MKKTCGLFVAAVFLLCQAFPAAAQETGISQDSSQTSSQDSIQGSSDQSSAESSASSETSFADSSNASSAQSSDQSSAATGDSPAGAVLVIAGAVVTVGLTVGGIILTVKAKRVKEAGVVRLQDQIYASSGAEYEGLIAFFGLDGRTVGRIHDELAASSPAICSDQSAADFLALFVLRLSERSARVKALLSGA